MWIDCDVKYIEDDDDVYNYRLVYKMKLKVGQFLVVYVGTNQPRTIEVVDTIQEVISIFEKMAIEANRTIHPFKFENVSCSQCGQDFGPGDHGYSHCEDHRKANG